MEETVLYVDDQDSNRRRGIISLEKTGINKFLAPINGTQCIDQIKPKKLKAAILDFKLEDWVGKNYEDSFSLYGRRISNGLDLAKVLLFENPAIKIGIFSAGADLMARVKSAGLKGKIDVINIATNRGVTDKHFYVPGYLGILMDQDNLTTEDLVAVGESTTKELSAPNIKAKPNLLSVNISSITEGELAILHAEQRTDTKADSQDETSSVIGKDTFTMRTYIKTYQPDNRPPAKNIQLFLAKKILNLDRAGLQFWKIGDFHLMLSSGKEIPAHYMVDDSLKGMVESLDEFEITVERESYRMLSLWVKSRNFSIIADNFSSALKIPDKPSEYDILCQLFVAKYICKLFLDKKSSINDTIATLKALGDVAQFESQKLLFKYLLTNLYFPVVHTEDIYELLEPFTDAELPMVLDIFKGTVRAIKDGLATVKLTSLSDPNRVRIDHFSHEFLNKYFLQEGSNFEYTVYKPSFGGVGYHIEPI